MKSVDKVKRPKNDMIPNREKKRIREDVIRAMYDKGYSMDQITRQGYSKTTVFLAIHKGRGKTKRK